MRKSRLIAFAAAATVAAGLASAPIASAATDYYLKIDGINGETQVGATTGAIQVSAFQLGAESSTSLAGAGASVGKAQLDQLKITKSFDLASPALFQKLTAGQVISGMELIAQKSGGATAPVTYLHYCFQPVFVTAQTTASGDDGTPQETDTFTYGGMQESYQQQGTNGAPIGTPAIVSWSQMTNSTNLIAPGTNGNSCQTSRFH